MTRTHRPRAALGAAHPPAQPPSRRAAPALWLLACAAASVSACGGARAPDRPLDVVVVLIDTLRADRLGCLGNGRGLTPAIDELASRSIVFEAASAHAPWTLPSTASLLTARLPAEHGAGGRLGAFTRLAKGVPTLASHLQERGYATGAVVNVSFLGPDFGLARGFAHHDFKAFDSNRKVRRADATTDAALGWVRSVRAADPGRPLFLLAHYFDPHAVYDPPAPWRRRFALEPDRGVDGLVFGTRAQMMALRAGRLALDPAVLRRAEALYDAEVAFTDSEVGRLLAGLDELGVLATAALALTADHGEEFLDHGGFEHGHTLYAELTHVPLILRAPGLRPGRVAVGVGLVDVAPTLLELAGVARLPDARGRSLAPLFPGGDEASDRGVLAHGNFWGPPLSSWRTAAEKLIQNPSGSGRPDELYRWREDPGEARDLASDRPERVSALEAELAAARAALDPARREAVELDEAQRRELESLGYLGGSED